jgi:glucose/arabinose dehydrogenase
MRSAEQRLDRNSSCAGRTRYEARSCTRPSPSYTAICRKGSDHQIGVPPWEITWGPDNYLWVTERAGKRVIRIEPNTGAKKVAVTIDEVLVGPQHQGLLGMALHPELLRGKGHDYVYLVYTYSANSTQQETEQDQVRAKIVRFTYDTKTETLGQPTELIAGIRAGNDHNWRPLDIRPRRNAVLLNR